jgi:cytochrome b6-f complex iron-sulfur subunit
MVCRRYPMNRPANYSTMKISRRTFLTNLGYGAFLSASGALAAAFARFLTPNIVTPASGPVEIGKPDEYAVGSLMHIESARVYLGRDARGLFAINATCTHLGCTVKHVGAGPTPGQFECPCHGSKFDAEGRVVVGPATRPLERARLTLDSNGRVVVDRAAIVDVDFRLAI